MDLNLIIEKKAKEFFSSSKGSHDWEHTQRVYNLCLHIGKKENADLKILKIAALLHDIGRECEDNCKGKICHAKKGASLAKELLLELKMDKTEIDKVVHCIETHRFRGSKLPVTKEAKVLFDADKLDSIGAVGIGRAFLFAGEIGATLHDKNINVEKTESYSREDTAYREYLVKLRKIKDRMQTKEGNRMAKERHEFMKEFFDRMNKEVEGEI
jgi:uncharacterized protein